MLPLMEQAFGWPFDPIDFDRTIKLDPRLRDGRIGFCAVEENRALGYVDLMDLTMRTENGKLEKLGHLQCCHLAWTDEKGYLHHAARQDT